jgi:hypothetical protein
MKTVKKISREMVQDKGVLRRERPDSRDSGLPQRALTSSPGSEKSTGLEPAGISALRCQENAYICGIPRIHEQITISGIILV